MTLEELIDEQSRVKEDRDALLSLLSSPGWETFRTKLLERASTMRMQVYGTAVRSMDGAFALSDTIARLGELDFMLGYPGMLINYADEKLMVIKREITVEQEID